MKKDLDVLDANVTEDNYTSVDLRETEPESGPKRKYYGGGKTRVTKTLYDSMLAAYKERASIGFIQKTVGVGGFMARRAVTRGWPELGLPAFNTILSTGFTKGALQKRRRESDEAKYGESRYRDERDEEDNPLEKHSSAKQAADEAFAARSVMKAAMKALRLNMMIADRLLEQFEMGVIPTPEEVTPKMVYQLTRSLDSAAAIAQKAIDIERKRIGEPEKALGMQIGAMLDTLTDAELYELEKTGQLPSRLITQRPDSIKRDIIEVPFEERPEATSEEEIDTEQLPRAVPPPTGLGSRLLEESIDTEPSEGAETSRGGGDYPIEDTEG